MKQKDRSLTIRSKQGINPEPVVLEEVKDDTAGIAKSILIIVEGETEEAYFEGLKGNELLRKQLAGVRVKRFNDLSLMIWHGIKEQQNYDQIWLILDNDKRNAFVLGDEFPDTMECLPQKIAETLKGQFKPELHNYFFSEHDYLQWLKSAVGPSITVEYWDRIKHNTEKKRILEKYEDKNPYALFAKSELFFNRTTSEYQNIDRNKAVQFDSTWKNHMQIGYSCLCIEFWLLLHFAKCKRAFLWNDKNFNESIDVTTYFKNHYRPSFVKGKEAGTCNAYTCLLDNFAVQTPSFAEQRMVIIRLIFAYKNALWLQEEMKPILERQNNKFYEVNPYIKGLNTLTKELLNLKILGEAIDYGDHTIIFDFNPTTGNLTLEVSQGDVLKSHLINNTHQGNFKVVTKNNNEYIPEQIDALHAEDAHFTKNISFSNIPIHERQDMVLFFDNPNCQGKHIRHLVLLS